MTCSQSVSFCQQIRNIDSLFLHYKKQKYEILRLLTYLDTFENLWTVDGEMIDGELLNIDPDCNYQMGRMPHSRFICSSCYNMRRMIDLESDYDSHRVMLAEKEILIQIEEVITPYVFCTKHDNIVSADEFSHNYILSIALQEEMKAKELLHYQRVYAAFVCHTTGYFVTRYAEPLSTVKKNSILHIEFALQFWMVLHSLRDLKITPLRASLDDWLVEESMVDCEYEGTEIFSSFRLLYWPRNANFTYAGMRFRQEGKEETHRELPRDCDPGPFYIYLILLVLRTGTKCLSRKDFRGFWSGMWLSPNDEVEVCGRMETMTEPEAILAGIPLKENVLDHMKSYL